MFPIENRDRVAQVADANSIDWYLALVRSILDIFHAVLILSLVDGPARTGLTHNNLAQQRQHWS